MANIKFGFNQLGKITPDQARWIPRIYSTTAAFIVGFTTNANLLSPFWQNTLNQFFIYFSPFVILIENMFGVTAQKGDITEVTAADITPK